MNPKAGRLPPLAILPPKFHFLAENVNGRKMYYKILHFPDEILLMVTHGYKKSKKFLILPGGKQKLSNFTNENSLLGQILNRRMKKGSRDPLDFQYKVFPSFKLGKNLSPIKSKTRPMSAAFSRLTRQKSGNRELLGLQTKYRTRRTRSIRP
jgi:hypothetical protein